MSYPLCDNSRMTMEGVMPVIIIYLSVAGLVLAIPRVFPARLRKRRRRQEARRRVEPEWLEIRD